MKNKYSKISGVKLSRIVNESVKKALHESIESNSNDIQRYIGQLNSIKETVPEYTKTIGNDIIRSIDESITAVSTMYQAVYDEFKDVIRDVEINSFDIENEGRVEIIFKTGLQADDNTEMELDNKVDDFMTLNKRETNTYGANVYVDNYGGEISIVLELTILYLASNYNTANEIFDDIANRISNIY